MVDYCKSCELLRLKLELCKEALAELGGKEYFNEWLHLKSKICPKCGIRIWPREVHSCIG